MTNEPASVGPPGRWICRTCGFVLATCVLRASDGAVGIDGRLVEDICPNDGSALRQVTWQEDAADANRVALDQMQRADAAAAALEADESRWHVVEEALHSPELPNDRARLEAIGAIVTSRKPVTPADIARTLELARRYGWTTKHEERPS